MNWGQNHSHTNGDGPNSAGGPGSPNSPSHPKPPNANGSKPLNHLNHLNQPKKQEVTLADVVKEAHRRVPYNDLNLPEGFHRSDLLSPELAVKRVVEQNELLVLPQRRAQAQPHQGQAESTSQNQAADLSQAQSAEIQEGSESPESDELYGGSDREHSVAISPGQSTGAAVDLSDGVFTDRGPLLVLDERVVRSAYVPLEYAEGFPTLPRSGAPFWSQLEFEPIEAFQTFEDYIKQGREEGIRRLFQLACIPEIQRRVVGRTSPLLLSVQRSNANLSNSPDDTGELNGNGSSSSSSSSSSSRLNPFEADEAAQDVLTKQFVAQRELVGVTNAKLQEWHTVYYWGQRARAHDLFYLEGIHRTRGAYALQLENRQYEDSMRLYRDVMSFIDGTHPESCNEEGRSKFWSQMTPKTLIDFMRELGRMSRISIGLPAAGPAEADSPGSVVSILHSLMVGSVGSPALLAPQGKRGRGRPRGDLDDVTPSAGALGSQNGPSSGTSDPSNAPLSNMMTDEERVRKLAMIFNAAKHRRDANKP